MKKIIASIILAASLSGCGTLPLAHLLDASVFAGGAAHAAVARGAAHAAVACAETVCR